MGEDEAAEPQRAPAQEAEDTALAAFVLMLGFLQKPADPEQLRHAAGKGCTSFYLETLSFQAPGFYRSLGYAAAFERPQFPHGIVKYYMLKELGSAVA